MIALLLAGAITLQTPDLTVRVRDKQGHLVRSRSRVCLFLRMIGELKSGQACLVPEGKRVDHIIPLALGGADIPANMQLLTEAEWAAKTPWERKLPGAWWDGTNARLLQYAIDGCATGRTSKDLCVGRLPDPHASPVVVPSAKPSGHVNGALPTAVDSAKPARSGGTDLLSLRLLAGLARSVLEARHDATTGRALARAAQLPTLTAESVLSFAECPRFRTVPALANAFDTDLMKCALESARDVHPMGDGFQVFDVSARPVSAKMVDLEAGSDWSVNVLPSVAMDERGLLVPTILDPVAFPILSARPEVARGVLPHEDHCPTNVWRDGSR